jgi:phosphatidylglycerol:prolipoprotein diacylglycerol transferase
MASHGGFIGVTVALWWFGRSQRIPMLHLGDLVVSTAPLGLMLGRVANFINGELWGKVATVPWAVVFPASGTAEPRHPSQLYAAALEGALLLIWLQWRFWRSEVVRAQPGRLVGEFFAGYALVRCFGELFREPDASLIFGVFSRGTFYSFFVFAAGVVLIVAARRRKKNQRA